MPVRRHIQEEGTPRLLAGLTREASMSFVGSIQSIDRSLHSDNVLQGKKKSKEKVKFIFILILELTFLLPSFTILFLYISFS